MIAWDEAANSRVEGPSCADERSMLAVAASGPLRWDTPAPPGSRRHRMTEKTAVGRLLGWLQGRSEGELCALVATVFWLYAAANRMIVRGALLAVRPADFLATPTAYALQYVLLAPALAFAHWAAFHTGWPRTRRLRAVGIHLALMLMVALTARLALDVASAWLFHSGERMWQVLREDVIEGFASPPVALSTGLDVLFQYSIALALIAGVIAWQRFEKEAAARAALALETERTRRMALRRQLDPHSLFNTLNAVAAAIRPTPNTAIAMIAALGDLLRESLAEDKELSTVEEEFSLAGRYLALYALRFPDRLTVAITPPGASAGVLVPTLLLQPLVENAALHGLESGAARVEVDLRATRIGAGVRIEIENTVEPGAQVPIPAQSPGIGLRNTWDRLITHYGPHFELRFERPAPGRLRLVLELPAEPLPAGA
jgi:two-component system, LytTR family, sensor kinase